MKEDDKEKAKRAARKLGVELHEPKANEALKRKLELLREAVNLKEKAEREAAERKEEVAIRTESLKEGSDKGYDVVRETPSSTLENSRIPATPLNSIGTDCKSQASFGQPGSNGECLQVSRGCETECRLKGAVKVLPHYCVREGEAGRATDFIELTEPHARKNAEVLDDYSGLDDFDVEPIRANVERCLNRYKINASIVSCSLGLTCVTVRCRLNGSERFNSIVGVQHELELAVGGDVTVSKLAGESFVAIFVSKRRHGTIGLKAALQSNDSLAASDMKIAAIGGYRQDGGVMFYDLHSQPHVLVAGTTGSGKSIYLHALIVSLMARYTPEYLRFLIIDIKQVEYAPYAGDPYLLTEKPITDVKDCATVFENLNDEMNRRYALFAAAKKKNLAEYNESTNEKLPYIVVVIDEFATLSDSMDNLDEIIRRIAAMARAAGIHIVIATQRPDVKSVSGTIRANIPSRIAFKTANTTDSRIIINVGDAKNLTGSGDMLIAVNGSSEAERLLSPYISSDELMNFLNSAK